MRAIALLLPFLAAAAPAAPPRVLRIAAHDFAFTMPDSLPAGTYTIEMTNDGRELHHAIVVRLDQGKRLADLHAAMKDGPPPTWASFLGGPMGPEPGSAPAAVTMRLDAGRYALVCLVPSADGVPHVAKGMAKEFVVVGATGRDALPKADTELTLRDYVFAFSRPLRTGRQVVQVTVPQGQPHEIVVMKLASGKSPMDVATWLEKPVGPPPASLAGGMAPIQSGATAQFTLDLTPGEYALLCFVPDQKDGKPHVAHGMMQQVRVGS